VELRLCGDLLFVWPLIGGGGPPPACVRLRRERNKMEMLKKIMMLYELWTFFSRLFLNWTELGEN
jgi:hypothetical protein